MSDKTIIWSVILAVIAFVSMQLSSFRRVDSEVWLFFIALFLLFVILIGLFLLLSYLYKKLFREKDNGDH